MNINYIRKIILTVFIALLFFSITSSSFAANSRSNYQEANLFSIYNKVVNTIKKNIFGIISAQAQATSPTVIMGTDGTKGQAPFTVQFMGMGIKAGFDNTTMTMQWNFGDGATATGWNPQHTYLSAGTYTATFTVTDTAGGNSSKQITITVTSGAPSFTYKYVSPTATGAGNGTQSNPWTPNQAFSLASPGNVVLFADGIYNVTNVFQYGEMQPNIEVSGTPSSPIIFKSQNYYGAILDGNNSQYHPLYSYEVHDIIIDGFEVRNGNAWIRGGNNIVLKNLKLHGADAVGETNYGGLFFISTNNALIENNEIYDIYDHTYSYLTDIDPEHHAGIVIMSSGEYGNPGQDGLNYIIRNNLIYNVPTGIYNKNWDYGPIFIYNNKIISWYVGTTVHSNNITVHNNIIMGDPAKSRLTAIKISQLINQAMGTRNASVYNNTIYNSGSLPVNPAGIIFEQYAVNPKIYNNIVYTPLVSSLAAISQGVGETGQYYNYNNYSHVPIGMIGSTKYNTLTQWRSVSGQDANSISADPLFVSFADFHLQSGSPAINAGVDLQDYDNDGNITEHINMGAYITGSEVIGLENSIPLDTILPSVSISFPFSGSTVSGNVSLTANASDNVSVSGVRFKLDGNNLGAEDIISPYSVSWDTSSVSNGPHTLTAVARDSSNNVAESVPINIIVNNLASPTSRCFVE